MQYILSTTRAYLCVIADKHFLIDPHSIVKASLTGIRIGQVQVKKLACAILFLLEKVPQDLFHSVYFEYEENSTHDRLLSLNYAFCHIKRLIKTSEPVYTD